MGVSGDTEDGFLDGRVRVRQRARGFRSGLDAVMLAAAIPAAPGDAVLELGSGVGVASLCLAARVRDCAITGAEFDGDLVTLANDNAATNAVVDRVQFGEADALNLPPALRRQFDHVFCNPPFHGPDGETSPDSARARALRDRGALAHWLQSGLKRTAANGSFTVVLRADRLSEALAALPQQGIAVFPLWPKQGAAAKRVLIQVRQGNRAPLALLPGLVLHADAGGYTPEADAVLRGRAALALT